MNEYRGPSFSYSVARPAPALEKEVEFYYQGESSVSRLPGTFLDVHVILLPLNCVEMIFNYDDTSVRLRHEKDSNQSSGKIVGQHNLHSICRADNITKVNKTFHVRLKPNGFRRLFGIPQVELKNSCLAVSDVLGNEGRDLEERMGNSDSFMSRIKIIETYLLGRKSFLKKTREARRADQAVGLIQHHHGRIMVRDILCHLGASERTLEWEFSNSVGLSPKEFIRVMRFREMFDRMIHGTAFDWSEHTRPYEYYDQAHFIKEFKAATTFSPESLREQFGKRIVKCINFILIVEPASAIQSPYYRQLFGDFLKVERENGRFLRPSSR